MSDLPTLYTGGDEDKVGPLEWGMFAVTRDGAEMMGTGTVTEFVPAARLDAANLEIARLKVMLGHMTRIVRDYEIPHGLFTYDNTRLVEAETAVTPKEPSDV